MHCERNGHEPYGTMRDAEPLVYSTRRSMRRIE